MAVNVPDGVRGDYSISTFEITEAKAAMYNVRAAARRSSRDARVSPGIYKRLMRKRTVVMSNTPAEVRGHLWAYHQARGRVLINGLGPGMFLQAILDKPDPGVTEVWVVEKAPEVLALVGPTFANESRVRLIEADALSYMPPRGLRFDFVWHDIWDTVSADNLDEMQRLHRRYGRRCAQQASWEREACEAQRRENNRLSGSTAWGPRL